MYWPFRSRAGFHPLKETATYPFVPVDEDKGPETSHSHLLEKGLPSQHKRSPWRRIPSNNVALAAWSCLTVFAINVIFLLVAIGVGTSHSRDSTDSHDPGRGLSVLFEGDCPTANRSSVGAHLLINTLSAILLAASNYTMQLLCAPSRDDLDKAHQKGTWMDIGCQSIRNLLYIPLSRRALWIVLAASSLPIHLLYNSAVTKVLQASSYSYVTTSNPHTTPSTIFPDSVFQNISGSDCRNVYNSDFVSGYGNLIIFNTTTTGAASTTNTTAVAAMGKPPDALTYAEYCLAEPVPSHCALLVSLPILGIVAFFNILKATAMFITMRMQRSPTLVTMGDAVADFLAKPDPVTEGRCLLARHDVRRSWLQRPAVDVTRKAEPVKHSNGPARNPFRRRWRNIPSIWLWVVIMLLWAIGLALACVFLSSAQNMLDKEPTGQILSAPWTNNSTNVTKHRSRSAAVSRETFAGLPMEPVLNSAPSGWYLARAVVSSVSTSMAHFPRAILPGTHPLNILNVASFGQVSAQALIPSSVVDDKGSALILSSLLVNAPQLFLSVFYMLYNSILTQMFAAFEYNSFAVQDQTILRILSAEKGKTLRVTRPVFGQRSSYYLQLPFRYAIPFITVSALLHWLMSQGMFLVQVWAYQLGEDASTVFQGSLARIGYSPAAIVVTVAVTLTVLLVLLLFGQNQLPGEMPIAGSCSLAISAAAHRHPDDPDAATSFLRWGEPVETREDDEKMGHCCFTSLEVALPEEERYYE